MYIISPIFDSPNRSRVGLVGCQVKAGKNWGEVELNREALHLLYIYEIEKQDESEIKTLRPGFLLSSDEKRWRGEKKRNVRRNAR